MEELGIGRPSTYASIVTTIQDRDYVRKEQNRLIPEDKGRLVTIFLLKYFPRYVSYDFTAHLEGELDGVSAGDLAWREALRRFWRDFTVARRARASCASASAGGDRRRPCPASYSAARRWLGPGGNARSAISGGCI